MAKWRRNPKKNNWNWNRDTEWTKKAEDCCRKCYECREEIEVNEERFIGGLKKSPAGRFYHLDCGEEKQQEIDIEANKLLSELTKDLAIIKQKEIDSLNGNDKKKIEEIKNEINLLSQKHLDNPFNTASIKLMKNSLQELEQEINNPASQKQSQSQNNQDSPASNNLTNPQNEEEIPRPPSTPNNNQRQRIQEEINNLENKSNKTQEEEADLKSKKEELERLNNSPNVENSDKKNWLKPTLIIGGIVLSGLVIYLITKNKKIKH